VTDLPRDLGPRLPRVDEREEVTTALAAGLGPERGVDRRDGLWSVGAAVLTLPCNRPARPR